MRNIIIATTLFAAVGLTAGAQTPKASPAGKNEVVEATMQKTRYEGTTSTTDEYRFTIIWRQATPPSAGFFYRSGNSWKETSITRPEKRAFSQNPQDYMMVEKGIEGRDVKPGDKIIITTHRHEHDEEPMPDAVKPMAKKGLFFGTGSGKTVRWNVIPVTIRVLPERRM